MTEYRGLDLLDPETVPLSATSLTEVKARGRRRVRIRRLAVASPVLVAAIVAAVVVTAIHVSGTSAQVSPAHPGQTAAPPEMRAALVAQVPGQGVSNVVPVPGGGYEAASWDVRGTGRFPGGTGGSVTFWSMADGGTWDEVGSATYPSGPDQDAEPTTVTGALVGGAPHATFIVDARFSGDGGANAVVFVPSGGSWSELRGNFSVGPQESPTAEVYFRDAYFADALLVTVLGDPYASNASASYYPILTRWKWSGTAFVRAADNAFRAALTASPPGGTFAPACPTADGSYVGELEAAPPPEQPVDAAGRVTGVPTVSLTFRPASGGTSCHLSAQATTALSVQARTTSGGSIWITAPLWLLTDAASADAKDGSSDGAVGVSNYVIPAGFDVASVTSDLGTPFAIHPTPAYGQVTISGGRVVAAAILPKP